MNFELIVNFNSDSDYLFVDVGVFLCKKIICFECFEVFFLLIFVEVVVGFDEGLVESMVIFYYYYWNLFNLCIEVFFVLRNFVLFV